MRPSIRGPVLQVALDLISVDDAIRIARQAIRGGADWLECGTPLIKSEGVRAIRLLRRNFGEVPIVADMKTIDVGSLEAKIAFEAGADIVSILALADDQTILGAIEEAEKYEGMVMADLINHPDPISRAKQLEGLGVNIILIHVGIDQQAYRGIPYGIVREIKEEVDCYIAVAGGINDQTAGVAVKSGADIVIVGRYITASENPGERARRVKEAMLSACSV